MSIGFVGWMGMVGSVLMERMAREGDFAKLRSSTGVKSLCFFSSNPKIIGSSVDIKGHGKTLICNSNNLDDLARCKIIVTCQGSDWSREIYPRLRQFGWEGIWLDASSAFRENKECTIVLDPINRQQILSALKRGGKLFAGGNCTVSLMLMALAGLFKKNLVAAVNYCACQAASSAGSKQLLETISQMGFLAAKSDSRDPLQAEKSFTTALRGDELPRENFNYPLVGNLLPFLGKETEGGQSGEEWEIKSEANKILDRGKRFIPIDGICVRTGILRCCSQFLAIRLSRDVPLPDIERIIASAHDWVKVIPNSEPDTLALLTPMAVTGKLNIHIGRLRKLDFGPRYLGAFTVGDQLLWGAAEPLRRALQIIVNKR